MSTADGNPGPSGGAPPEVAEIYAKPVPIEAGESYKQSLRAETKPVDELKEIGADIFVRLRAEAEEELGRLGHEPKPNTLDRKSWEKKSEKLLQRYRRAHPEFARSFPVVLRWMVAAREYDAGVFAKWAVQNIKPTYKDRHEFLEVQGKYIIDLRAGKERLRGARRDALKRSVLDSLAREEAQFTAAKDHLPTAMAELDAEVREENAAALGAAAAADPDARAKIIAGLLALAGSASASSSS
jgi:hypothetical protein